MFPWWDVVGVVLDFCRFNFNFNFNFKWKCEWLLRTVGADDNCFRCRSSIVFDLERDRGGEQLLHGKEIVSFFVDSVCQVAVAKLEILGGAGTNFVQGRVDSGGICLALFEELALRPWEPSLTFTSFLDRVGIIAETISKSVPKTCRAS